MGRQYKASVKIDIKENNYSMKILVLDIYLQNFKDRFDIIIPTILKNVMNNAAQTILLLNGGKTEMIEIY